MNPQNNSSSYATLVVLIVVALLVLASGGCYLYSKNTSPAPIAPAPETTTVNDRIVSTPEPVVPDVKSDTNSNIDLWTIFDKSVEALKNKDATAFNTVSYKQVTSVQKLQFAQMVSFLYADSIKINKSDYVNKWQDDKQAIYSTNPVKTDDAQSYGYTQGSIMFINDKGTWKILSENPSKGWSISKNATNKPAAQIEKDLQTMMLDSDKDGITDMDEACTGAQQYNSKCVKTDPGNRDTNGNGLWDGIDVVIKG